MYSIRYDAGTRILHLQLEGFWTVATLARFTAELVLHTAKLKLRHIDYAVLSDSSRFAIQSPAVSQGFERIMSKGADSHRGPTAVVVASRLNKLQAERTLKGDRVRIFLVEAEARAWLALEMAPATA
jgi:hypothetical protein